MPRHPFLRASIRTQSRSQMLDITPQVQRFLRQKNVIEGYAIVYVPHTTAAVTINENADPDVKNDMLQKLDALVPKAEPYYQHNEGNSDSHVKTSLVGNHVLVLIESGRLVLGQWQGIYFCEFDGPREREFVVKVVDLKPQRGD
jgi:secondary thiamine-phosphate synthase enzyme